MIYYHRHKIIIINYSLFKFHEFLRVNEVSHINLSMQNIYRIERKLMSYYDSRFDRRKIFTRRVLTMGRARKFSKSHYTRIIFAAREKY